MNNLFADLCSFVRTDVPLAMHTWLQLGGAADYFAEPRNLDELRLVLQRSHTARLPVRVLGYGSNILAPDTGVRGVVIRLMTSEFTQITASGTSLVAGGGAKLGRCVTASVHAGLSGLEGLIGVPGTLGGALRGNAGAHGDDIGQWVESIEVLDFAGVASTLMRSELLFGYRTSSLENLVIVSAKLTLTQDDPVTLGRRMQKLWIVRRTSQPMNQQGTGRLFKDARGVSASELIADVGLKGTRLGGAALADRDANFIILDPEATATDVTRLIDLVQHQIRQDRDIDLELQLEVW